LLSARDLERLGRAQIDRLGVPLRAWSVELAPGSVKPDKLAVLKDLGVNRVSLGVQSFSPRLLDALGRQHSLDQVNRAWELIEEGGFPSRTLDLMFALPGQSLEEWRDDLREAIARGADHISTYCLTFEEDTALFVKLSAGKVSIDIERDRSFYEETWRVMREAGFEQYEISNYARPGHICIHNQNTWRMHQWAGIGPSAAGQEGGWRSANPPDLQKWADQVGSGIRGSVDRVPLSDEQLAEDCLIFGLRMNEGIVLEDLEERFSPQILAPHRVTLERLVAEGVLCARGTTRLSYSLSDAGRLVADAVGTEFLHDGIESG
jgi:oxygen-independent coproporphyrinogen-3 oxidase